MMGVENTSLLSLPGLARLWRSQQLASPEHWGLAGFQFRQHKYKEPLEPVRRPLTCITAMYEHTATPPCFKTTLSGKLTA
jgi:hypothetical protein